MNQLTELYQYIKTLAESDSQVNKVTRKNDLAKETIFPLVNVIIESGGFTNGSTINFNIEIREDNECVWTDGDITGYCTEFYKDDIEIGNIVNTLDTCIDVGFGLERILFILNKEIQQPIDILKESILFYFV